MTIKITPNFDKRILQIGRITGNPRRKSGRAIKDSLEVIENAIADELKSPDKSGVAFRGASSRYQRFSKRRSAPGESLASDTGSMLSRITSTKLSSVKGEVGIASNGKYNYARGQEEKNNRPTLENAVRKSIEKISKIFENRFKI